jgi:hypothetical protein
MTGFAKITLLAMGAIIAALLVSIWLLEPAAWGGF